MADARARLDNTGLMKLAVRYVDARRAEKATAVAAYQTRRLAPNETTRRRAAREHLRANEQLMLARRALADGVARVLVRGHQLDCACRTCAAERAALMPAKAPRKKAARR